MAVYTKTGDKGTTGTFSGKRVLKSSKLINAIGAIDELNSYLGIINTGYKDIKILSVQKNLFTINAVLAGFHPARSATPKDAIKKLEREIDEMEGKMPVLANFLIYSGCKKSRELYFARALARRAERVLIAYGIQHTANLLPYINRLSDYLFTLARFINFKKKIKEEIWKVE